MLIDFAKIFFFSTESKFLLFLHCDRKIDRSNSSIQKEDMFPGILLRFGGFVCHVFGSFLLSFLSHSGPMV